MEKRPNVFPTNTQQENITPEEVKPKVSVDTDYETEE